MTEAAKYGKTVGNADSRPERSTSMSATSKLKIIAWLYVMVGGYALIGEAVGWWMPVQLKLPISFEVFGFETMTLLLLFGIGLHRKDDGSRNACVFCCWVAVVLVVAATVLFIALAVGASDSIPMEEYGDMVVHTLAFVLIGIPVFVWQFRALRSREIRELTSPSSLTYQNNVFDSVSQWRPRLALQERRVVGGRQAG